MGATTKAVAGALAFGERRSRTALEPRLAALRDESSLARSESLEILLRLKALRSELQSLADHGRLHAAASWKARQR